MSLLKEPITIKNITFHNRLFMPPMATGKSDNGKVSKAILDWYDEKTKGGYIGLVIVEHDYVSPEGMASANQLSVSCDEDIEGLAALADVIHANGSRAMLQINHAGGKSVSGIVKAPSAMEYKRHNGPSVSAKEMDEADIQQVINDFAAAAVRAKKAGYDGVEIHAAHGYLLSQFYSPLFNKRTDAYSGETIEGRTKLHTDILKAVREAVGDDYLVAIRFGICDDMEGGADSVNGPSAAKLFEEAGADLIDITGGMGGYIRPGISAPGYFKAEAQAAAAAVNVPVITAGGITTRTEAEDLLAFSSIAMAGAARAIYKDSDWAKNAMAD